LQLLSSTKFCPDIFDEIIMAIRSPLVKVKSNAYSNPIINIFTKEATFEASIYAFRNKFCGLPCSIDGICPVW
jgi:hypothetical protein